MNDINLTLSAISPIDGRYKEKTKELSNYFSEFALIRYRVLVEISWVKSLSENKKITHAECLSLNMKKKLSQIVDKFSLVEAGKIKELEKVTNHDVKAVEYWIQDRFKGYRPLKQLIPFIHFGCTSEDINNVSYALMIRDAKTKTMLPIINKLVLILTNLAHATADVAMISRTHGQIATPTTMGKEIANIVYRIKQQTRLIENFKMTAKMNGAVGNLNAHTFSYPGVNWRKISKDFITNLGLENTPYTTQIEPHDKIAELFDSFRRLNNVILDLNRDMWAYISIGYFKQRTNLSETGSSTMPHKVNPIDFENSEGNLGIANTIFNHLSDKLQISRLQRDLSDSTVMRNIGVGFGHSLLAYKSTIAGLRKLKINNTQIRNDIEDSWEVLAEPIQTIMRKNGISDAYEQLKYLTRGSSSISKSQIRQFIETIPISEFDRRRLRKLEPATYTGIAAMLAKEI